MYGSSDDIRSAEAEARIAKEALERILRQCTDSEARAIAAEALLRIERHR